LTLHRGEVVGLAGLAGSGRTELLDWLFGADDAPARRVTINGREVTIRGPQDAIRQGIGLGPDDRKGKGVVRGAAACENIALPGRRQRLFLSSADERRAAGQLMGDLRIRAVSLDQPLRHLSGGNQQKAVLAKWLSAGSNIFLLDEPTRGVDVRSKAEI